MNTTLDDIASVVGFSATLTLVAWFGDGVSNVWVPAEAKEGQLLVRLIGMPAAQALSREFPSQHLSVPSLNGYGLEMRKRMIARLLSKGFSTREVGGMLEMSERRVQQIAEELRGRGLIETVNAV